MHKKTILCLLLLLMTITAASAVPLSIRQDKLSQDSFDNAILYGYVVNHAGYGLNNAKITAINTKTEQVYMTCTDPLGKFGLNVPVGSSYDILFEYNGNIKEYKGKSISRRTYFYEKMKVSFSMSGNYEWIWQYHNHSKLATTDFKFSRLYIGDNQLFRLLESHSIVDSGLAHSASHGRVGSKVENTLVEDNVIIYSMNNADFTVFDTNNGYSYISFKDDSVVKVVLPERDWILTSVSEKSRRISYTDDQRQNSLVLVGFGEMRCNQQDIDIFAKQGSTLLFMPNTNIYMDTYINDLLADNIDVILEVFTTDNGQMKVVPVSLSPDCSIKNMTFENGTFEIDISTLSYKKISVVLSCNTSEYTLIPHTVNGEAIKKAMTSKEAMALSVSTKEYVFYNDGKTYQYIVMPDNKDAKIIGAYTKRI